ncbi:MAG: OmpA family protein [Bacteroidetes bacterium]|nr:OmpA family protein [Bacteroidota bacterium]
MGLFIILYAISNIDLHKYRDMMTAMGSIFGDSKGLPSLQELGNEKIETPISSLKDDLNTVIKRYKYENSVALEENERGIVIHILDDVLFNSGQAELNRNSQEVLHRLAAIIRLLPNDIRIEGHTDNIQITTGVYPSNWHLSVARALNTAYFLIKNENLSPEKLSIVGNSEYKPMATNETVEGRAKNRRVDIVIIK